ncbi:hypothetical protein [Miniphocaeibacter massiliensis]|uniref:hypothetical protein n=1 Tax=Miniphocaeibacter massiliensis TaxID=2041841 RepID=UPI000C1C300E|nr:hypothetical protein [Miniphocaeibacter massiliensis]
MKEQLKIYVLKVLVNHKTYYLAGLDLILSRNIEDSVLFFKEDISNIDGKLETELEKELGVIVTCLVEEVEEADRNILFNKIGRVTLVKQE